MTRLRECKKDTRLDGIGRMVGKLLNDQARFRRGVGNCFDDLIGEMMRYVVWLALFVLEEVLKFVHTREDRGKWVRKLGLERDLTSKGGVE